jgi:hypothetical protein
VIQPFNKLFVTESIFSFAFVGSSYKHPRFQEVASCAFAEKLKQRKINVLHSTDGIPENNI